MSKSKILYMCTGSIAAFKSAQAVSALVQRGHDVQVALSHSGERFVGKATWEGLTGKPVFEDLWQAGRMMDHIDLTRWADIAVLCPASANALAELANGFAGSTIGALSLAWPKNKPYLIFPAMNALMYQSKPVQKNIETLRDLGFCVFPTESGNLACGEVGEGRLLSPDSIVLSIENALKSKGRILVTGGATREPLDGVRFISNVSTGQTAAELVDLLTARGFSVDGLFGAGAKLPKLAQSISIFTTVDDLKSKIHSRLTNEEYLAVIHAAAVSDYRLANPETELKWKSGENLRLELRPTEKILPQIKEFAKAKAPRVIGFKMTLNSSKTEGVARAREILGSNVDAIVANDWSQVYQDRTRHPGQWVDEQASREFITLSQLADMIDDFLAEPAAREKMYDALS